MRIKVQKILPAAILPTKATSYSAGYDLYCAEAQTIYPGDWRQVRTGIALEIPRGFEGQVRSRSGLGWKYGITVMGGMGTIDADYRGEILVQLINQSEIKRTLELGQRIAQLIIAPVQRVEYDWSETLSETGRGTGGFGSTGK